MGHAPDLPAIIARRLTERSDLENHTGGSTPSPNASRVVPPCDEARAAEGFGGRPPGITLFVEFAAAL